MFKKIVVPLDGSLLAEQALSFLPRFVSPLQTHIDLVCVVQPWVYALGMSEATPISVINDLHENWQAYLHQQEIFLQGLGYTVQSHVLEGDIAAEILALAANKNADLIVMSTHGRSGFRRLALGSVAERVLHNATIPLLLVREGAALHTTNPIEHLLVPLDGSSFAERSIPLAVELSTQTGATLTMLRVVQDLDAQNKQIIFKSEEAAEEAVTQWKLLATRYLDELAKGIKAEGVKVSSMVLSGDPENLIGTIAETLPADLIVMSTHGRSGVSRWVYGSVANKVLRTASCPVLLVRNEVDEL
jgi:nucleotide-binding universal stress UspA family protein